MRKGKISLHSNELLDKSEFQNIFQEINHGVVIVNGDGCVVFVNDAFCDLLELTKQQQKRLLNKEITSLYSSHSLTLYIDHVRERLKKKQSWVGEVDFIGKAKKFIRTSCEIIPILSSNGEIVYYVYWINRSLGDKTLICPSLDETIEFFHALFEIASDPIYIVDENGKVIVANKKLASVTKYSNQELLSKTIYDLEETITSEKQFASLIKKVDKKEDVVFHGKLIGKNNSSYSVEIDLKKIALCGKSAILVYLHDISLREKYQKEAKRNDELRSLITKITNRFSLVSIKSFDNAANNALGDLGKFSGVDRCYLFRLEDNKQFLDNTHEWCSKHTEPQIDNLRHIPSAPYMWFYDYFQNNNCFSQDRIDDLTGKYVRAREEFKREGIKSMLVVPLKRGKVVFGAVGFDAVAQYVKWDPVTIQLLTDFSNFIAQALDRRETLFLQEQKKKLELMFTKKLLNATEGQLAFFIKHVPSPIAMFDRDMRYVAVSDRWLEDFHVKKKAIIGKLHYEIFKSDQIKWKDVCKRCLRGETLLSEKDCFVSVDGKSEWIKWKVYPRIGDDNKVFGIIILSEIITERIKNEEKILHMTQYDMLTDVPNRQYFREILTGILECRGGKKHALLVISIDNIDMINNYYNIFVGDRFIQEVAKRLKNCLVGSSFVARFDGGQFVCILDSGNKRVISRFIGAINSSISQPFRIQNYHIRTTVSIGVRIFLGGDLSYEELIKDTEIALHQAKMLPGGKVAYFDSVLEKKYLRDLLLENELQQALDASQFYVVYQPLFSFRENMVVGAEALVRWRHPKLKEILPSEFIPITEKVGKIMELGYWILEKVFSDINRLMKKIKNYNQFTFSINLSPDQLLDKKFFSVLKGMINNYKIPTRFLQFEITETKLSQSTEEVVSVLKKIKGLGCKIAIDDFGTGHSTLERLRELPVSTLKIDKCFVDDINKSEKNTALVKHTLMMAGELKITTVGEGIESEAQAHMLKFLGCDIAQGFYYSKPILIKEFEKRYLNNNRKNRS